jgi:ATP-dependent Clp protease ATP-binding subunit ClpB
MDVDIRFTDAAVSLIAKAGFDPVYGARRLKRAIQQQGENPLSNFILEGKFGPKDGIEVSAKNGCLASRSRRLLKLNSSKRDCRSAQWSHGFMST